jgi:serine protease Do
MSKMRLMASLLLSSVAITVSAFALSGQVSDKKAAEEKVVPPPKEEIKAPDAKKPSLNSCQDITKGFSAVADKTIPSVVNVSTTQIIEGRDRNMLQLPPGSPFEDLFKDFFDQMEKPRRVQSLGSGFIVTVEGKAEDPYAYILTNFHVVSEAKKVTVILHDGVELEATVQAVDERTDIAMLKVKLTALPAEKRNLVPVEWSDSNKVNVGDWCVAIGNPFGLGSTVTAGIISNRSRNIGVRGNAKSRLSEYVDDFMQHDAPINMGNSGGPLFDLEGKVIGVNTAIFSPSGGNVGIGFAIPSNLVKETLDQLIKFGRTKRGWLGVHIQNVTDEMAESYGLKKAQGAIISSVTPKGPAAIAGIEPNDIILEFDEKEINEKTRLSRVVGETEVGKKVKVKLLRKGKEIEADVSLGEFETSNDGIASESKDKNAAQGPSDVVEILGLKISKITGPLSQQFRLKADTTTGVVVIGISDDSPAAGVLRPGDVVVDVNQSDVRSPEEFVKVVEEAKRLKRKNITFLVIRNGERVYLTSRMEDDLKP